ncbi:MAG: hypothetical protein H7A38_03745 [Chlamydiales bacterium]|nr:hypothetical protein [Chlamydiales bacterium]
MAEPIGLRSHTPPQSNVPLSDEEAMRLLMEELDNVEVSPTPSAKMKPEESAKVKSGIDLASLAWSSNEIMMSFIRISPNLVRSVMGLEGKVSIVNIHKIFGMPLSSSIASRLFQVENDAAVEVVRGLFHQTTLPKLQTLPEEQLLPAVDQAITAALQQLIDQQAIKEVALQEGADLVQEPFPIMQESSLIPANKKRLEGFGVPEGSPEYQLMLHDPHLLLEIDVATFTLYSRDKTFEKGARKAAEQSFASFADIIETSSAAEQKELHEKFNQRVELELRKFLDEELAWGRFFLQRRDLLVSQYQGREVKKLAPPSSNLLEGILKVPLSKLKLLDIELYQKDLKLLRAQKEGEKTGALINLQNFGLPISSESGFVRFKDMERLQQIFVQLSEVLEKDGMSFSVMSLGMELQSLIVPLSRNELREQVTLMNQLNLSETPLNENIKPLALLEISENDELYEVLSKDPNLGTEIELAEIGVCVKDVSIATDVLTALDQLDFSSLTSTGEIGNLQAAQSAMREGFHKLLDERLGANKERYYQFLIETLKEHYRARLGK